MKLVESGGLSASPKRTTASAPASPLSKSHSSSTYKKYSPSSSNNNSGSANAAEYRVEEKRAATNRAKDYAASQRPQSRPVAKPVETSSNAAEYRVEEKRAAANRAKDYAASQRPQSRPVAKPVETSSNAVEYRSQEKYNANYRPDLNPTPGSSADMRLANERSLVKYDQNHAKIEKNSQEIISAKSKIDANAKQKEEKDSKTIENADEVFKGLKQSHEGQHRKSRIDIAREKLGLHNSQHRYEGHHRGSKMEIAKEKLENQGRHRESPSLLTRALDKDTKLQKVIRGGSKVLGPIALGIDGYDLYRTYKEDGFGKEFRKEAAGVAGSWIGASAGALLGRTAGMAGGAAGGPAGIVVGGIGGGIVGGIGGSYAGESLGENIELKIEDLFS
jgi:hypothetical protein